MRGSKPKLSIRSSSGSRSRDLSALSARSKSPDIYFKSKIGELISFTSIK